MIKIDIIIPTYNRANYLKIAIESVLNQTYKDYHLYILDNCSTDNTREVIELFKSEQLTYIKNKTNIGFVGNLNKALHIGESEFFHIFHDDDVLEPIFLESVISLFNKYADMVFLHTAAHKIDNSNKTVRRFIHDYPEYLSGKAFFEYWIKYDIAVICPSVVFRREKISGRVFFNKDTPYTADEVFFVACSNYGGVGYINKPIIQYREHTGSLTSTLYDNYDSRLKDRHHHTKFLIEEIGTRKIDIKNNYPNKYYKKSLSKDIWFMRMQGTSIINICMLIPKIVKTLPQLLFFGYFWFSILKIFTPVFLINYYKQSGLRKLIS